MTLKFMAVVGVLICPIVAGCQTGNSVWSKPNYQPAPVTNGASRTYTPTESVSPYQQTTPYQQGTPSQQNNPGYGGSSTR